MSTTVPGAGESFAFGPGAGGGAACAGADAAFRALFDAHAGAVHRMLLRLTRNPADADDLLQETFLAVWRKRGQYGGRGSVEGWIRKTAFRLWLNERKKRRRRDTLDARVPRPAVPPSAPPADGEVARREGLAFLAARVDEALDELPDEPREAFVLFRYDGLTCAEIGDLMDLPAKTVETRVRRATELLAQRLAPWRDLLAGR